MRLSIVLVTLLWAVTPAVAGGRGGGKSSSGSYGASGYKASSTRSSGYAGGAVSVRGYVRSDGTYVAPHYRSAPDGNFGNNWSTIGNVNPYTGTPGTKAYPSSNHGSRSSSSSGYTYSSRITGSSQETLYLPSARGQYAPAISGAVSDAPPPALHQPLAGQDALSANPACDSVASRVRAHGYDVDCTRYSLSTLMDAECRIVAAKRIQRLGVDVDWQRHSLSALLDSESRIEAANRIRRLGYEVDWSDTSLSTMLDWESRIGVAKRLGKLGYEADWKELSLSNLLNAESRIEVASRIERLGYRVNWRKYSLVQLLSFETAIESH